MRPLVLDLDGTLLRTDLLVEGILALLRRNILMLIPLALWCLRGRAFLKRKVAERAALDVALLPANAELVAYAIAEKERGREIVLATAADELMARRIAQRFDFIDRVIASDGRINLKGEAKAARLRELFPHGFHYAGDSHADLPVWKAADQMILVEPASDVTRAAKLLGRPVIEFKATSIAKALLKGLRLHQWAKNALIFLPLVLGGKAGDAAAWWAAGGAFLALGLVASASYLLNDLWDLPHDRAHWSKCNRPLASGRLPISIGILATIAGLALGLAIGGAIGAGVLIALLGYLAVTLTYSMSIKRVPVLDAVTLGVLFTLRIAIGVMAVKVAWSPWLLTFSMFLFTSLSFAKRHVEMRGALRSGKDGKLAGRGYESTDEPIIMALGIAAGIASVVIFILYLNNEAFRNAALAAPLFLWGFPPVLTLWIGRIWILAGREELNDDPVAFAVKDRVSLYLGGVAGFAFLLAATGVPSWLSL
jgi:4-hydroxybenzoate polyprenyltransferase/phosphoserine phosphatase